LLICYQHSETSSADTHEFGRQLSAELLNSDSNIQGDDRLNEIAEQIVWNELGSIASRITRTEVHVNGVKGTLKIDFARDTGS